MIAVAIWYSPRPREIEKRPAENRRALRPYARNGLLVALRGAFEGGLGRGEAGDGNAERRAGNVVEADLVAERRSTVGSPPCSPQMPTLRSGRVLRPSFDGHAPSAWTMTGSSDWNGLYGRILSSTYLSRNLPSASSRLIAERHLGQVVGAEAEELGVLGDLVRRPSGARDLDHRAELVVDLDAGGLDDRLGLGLEERPESRQLVHVADERDHDLRARILLGLLHARRPR